MPSVLVIEDDENKLVQLCAFLKELLPHIVVRPARSLQAGLREIKRDIPGLVLLDMTLPNYDPTPDDPGGQTHSFGGEEFLKQLDRFDIHVPVIVVTQFTTIGRGSQAVSFEDLDKRLRQNHSGNYTGSVYYHASMTSWRERLQQLIIDSVAL